VEHLITLFRQVTCRPVPGGAINNDARGHQRIPSTYPLASRPTRSKLRSRIIKCLNSRPSTSARNVYQYIGPFGDPNGTNGGRIYGNLSNYHPTIPERKLANPSEIKLET
jgi:hypothetical protein